MSGQLLTSCSLATDSARLDAGAALPDVSVSERSCIARPLDWVGMRDIRMPVWLDDALSPAAQLASISALVNLPDASVKGIHMSRLYGLLFEASQSPLSPQGVVSLLGKAVVSHAECGSNAAKLSWRTEMLRPTQALVTQGLEGWSSYKLLIDATAHQDRVEIWAEVEIIYSSTCPCSASLARQLIAAKFQQEHGQQNAGSVERAGDWIEKQGTSGKTHSQRSRARVRGLADGEDGWQITRPIEAAEAARGKRREGPVKRADEQEFALRNGENLMFVEDAARRLLSQLQPMYPSGTVEVTHLESLHPHDAFAQASWTVPA